MSLIPTWSRSAFQPGGAPNAFHLFCFSPGPLPQSVPFSASQFGLPLPEAMSFVEVRELTRDLDPSWFDGFRAGALRTVAQQALGDLSGLDGATQLTAVLINRADAADLVHVQAGWAVAKWLVARGARVVLDAQTNRFWHGADLTAWPASRPFALSADVNVVVEAEPTAALATIHTRGLQKFGRPDLVVLDVPGARWDAVAALVRNIAAQLVDGVVLRAGDTVVLGDERVKLAAFAPTAQTELHLNNTAFRLTPA